MGLTQHIAAIISWATDQRETPIYSNPALSYCRHLNPPSNLRYQHFSYSPCSYMSFIKAITVRFFRGRFFVDGPFSFRPLNGKLPGGEPWKTKTHEGAALIYRRPCGCVAQGDKKDLGPNTNLNADLTRLRPIPYVAPLRGYLHTSSRLERHFWTWSNGRPGMDDKHGLIKSARLTTRPRWSLYHLDPKFSPA